MAMRAIYKGGFYSVGGTLYEVEILKEGYAGATTEIAFGEDPLTIEWADVDKLEPVMSSSARIQLFSDSDRQFVGLYTVETGSVRMDLYPYVKWIHVLHQFGTYSKNSNMNK